MADDGTTTTTVDDKTKTGGTDQSADAVKAAQFERDKAVGEAAKLRKRLEDLEGRLPSEDQLSRWKDLESAAEKAEEDRKKKAGEFDALRQQLVDKHAKEMKDALDGKASAEQRLHDTLIGLAFAGATEWFGPSSKTVLLPDVAQSYFGKSVAVESNGDGLPQVVVKDAHGNTVLDPATGKPMEFAKAIGELIEAHPKRDHLLRNSGKVGSGSAGGHHGSSASLSVDDLIKRAQSGDKDALKALQDRQRTRPGTLQMGPHFNG